MNYTFQLSATTVWNGIEFKIQRMGELKLFKQLFSAFQWTFFLSLSSGNKLPVPRTDFVHSFPFWELSYPLVCIFESKLWWSNLVARHIVKIFIFVEPQWLETCVQNEIIQCLVITLFRGNNAVFYCIPYITNVSV